MTQGSEALIAKLVDLDETVGSLCDVVMLRPSNRCRHWGELLPFWSDRTNSLSRVAGLERTVSDYLRTNVHLTCSGMLSPALLRHALEVTTPDRLLFSTDYPFQRPDRSQIGAFLTELPDDAARDGFTAGNAAALFGIELDAQRDSSSAT